MKEAYRVKPPVGFFFSWPHAVISGGGAEFIDGNRGSVLIAEKKGNQHPSSGL